MGFWSPNLENVQVDLRQALAVGVMAAVVTLAGAYLVGLLSGADVRLLLEGTLSNTRAFAGTVVVALSTILALMLTLISLSSSADVDLAASHYRRIQQIAWFGSITLIAGILTYLLLNFPLEEAQSSGGTVVNIIYYVTLVLASLLGGALSAVILMLYNAARDIIRIVAPDEME